MTVCDRHAPDFETLDIVHDPMNADQQFHGVHMFCSGAVQR